MYFKILTIIFIKFLFIKLIRTFLLFFYNLLYSLLKLFIYLYIYIFNIYKYLCILDN
jgi:hypothetical protein